MEEHGVAELQWPSKRIPQGGIFHNHRVEYTPETQKLMKVLMEESKLTLQQRKQMDWCLRSGSSLSQIQPVKLRGQSAHVITRRPRTSRRRSFSAIKNSGDFERERYRPIHNEEDREVVKLRLQEMMEFGKCEGPPLLSKLRVQKEPDTKLQTLPEDEEILHDLLTQIQERETWLEEMESLGEGAKHREVIRDQIAERIRKIESLNLRHLQNNDSRQYDTQSREDKKQRKSNTRQSTPGSVHTSKISSETEKTATDNSEDNIRSYYQLHKPHPAVSVMSVRNGSASSSTSNSVKNKLSSGKKSAKNSSHKCPNINEESNTTSLSEVLRIDCTPKLTHNKKHGSAESRSKKVKSANSTSSKVTQGEKGVNRLAKGDGLNEENIAQMSLKCCSYLPTDRSALSHTKTCCDNSIKKM